MLLTNIKKIKKIILIIKIFDIWGLRIVRYIEDRIKKNI